MVITFKGGGIFSGRRGDMLLRSSRAQTDTLGRDKIPGVPGSLL